MNILDFHYYMKISFDSPVTEQRFTVKCLPISTECQQIQQLTYEIFPGNSLVEGTDSFENRYIYGQCSDAHDCFEYSVQGTARTGLASRETAGPEEQLGRYRYPTFYTAPGEHLRRYHQTFSFSPETSTLDKGLLMMHQLYQDMAYTPGATDINTTAEEAIILRKGVCQDYAHILIALCHLSSIPVRYIVGMLLGEGASHAWVEIYCDGYWYGLDPTNNVLVNDQHIKISKGRDYKDCLVNQGVFVGNAKQTQEISVSVSLHPDRE